MHHWMSHIIYKQMCMLCLVWIEGIYESNKNTILSFTSGFLPHIVWPMYLCSKNKSFHQVKKRCVIFKLNIRAKTYIIYSNAVFSKGYVLIVPTMYVDIFESSLVMVNRTINITHYNYNKEGIVAYVTLNPI